MRSQRLSKTSARGFTLIEMSTVVVIVGILAGLAVYGVRKYIQSAKSSEPIQMIQSIKAAQEQYRADTFTYLDVSGSHTLSSSTYYPTSSPSGKKVWAWGDVSTTQGQAFRSLGVAADAPVRFAYGCAAGGSADAVPSPALSYTVQNWPTAQFGPWYVVRAIGDLDDDGLQSVFVGSSFSGSLAIDNEGE